VDLDLTDVQKALRDKAREISLCEIAPRASAIDREQRFPQESLRRLAELGMLGLTVPKAFGGAGHGTVACALVLEELAAACASTAAIASLQNLLVCEPIARFGSEPQKRQWLPGLASGTGLGCFAFAEPGGAPTPTTTARREGSKWILQGEKSFVTAGPAARCALVFTAGPSGAEGSMSAFLVPTDARGVSFGPVLAKLGLRGAVATSMSLDAVELSADALLGAEGKGQEIFRHAVEGSRIGVAAIAVGIARAACAAATQYAVSHRTNGQAVAEHQTIQFLLAEMSTQIDAARLLTWRAAHSRDVGADMGAQASMAKLLASEVASRVSNDAVQVFGASGCLSDSPVERCFRDAKVTELYEGTSEIQRLGIASVLLKD
jgi:butyryl-CoA dehydrogenase